MTKVLIVTTSHDHFEGVNPHPTGVWMEEFALPYLELLKNGVEMTIASPRSPVPRVVKCPLTPVAIFIAHENKADHVERDGNIITGQNPKCQYCSRNCNCPQSSTSRHF